MASATIISGIQSTVSLQAISIQMSIRTNTILATFLTHGLRSTIMYTALKIVGSGKNFDIIQTFVSSAIA